MFVQIVYIYASKLKKATKLPKRNYLMQLLIHVIKRYRLGQLSPVILNTIRTERIEELICECEALPEYRHKRENACTHKHSFVPNWTCKGR